MILKQGFHLHPKTVMLRTRGGSGAVEALQQLWLFAENARMWQFRNWSREFVAAVGSIYGKPDLADLLTETGFLDLMPGGGFALHDFAEHNGALIQRWENGRFGQLGAKYGNLGGRPRNPRETPGGGSGKPPVGGPKNPPTRPDQTSKEIPLQPSSPTAEELPLSGEPDRKPKAKAPHPPNPLFDALAELEKSGSEEKLTESAAGAVGKALAEIVEASPGVTPDEIRRRAGNLRAHFPNVGATASSLAKHWARCANPPRETNSKGRPGSALAEVEAELRGMANPSMRELQDSAWNERKATLERRRAELRGGATR
jgi:hypothetical protein